jgi:2-polyprenyl-3-methyl-5-hydroxy-6-metoxy-1,4-benzoquinol methylase
MAGKTIREREERWRDEVSFFDKSASQLELKPVDPLTLRRYQGPLRRRFHPEYSYRVPDDLRGKRILDVGCGTGVNAVILALLGADVTGIDISPKSIEIARKRAEINQVERSCRFVCSPLETADLPPDYFDIISAGVILPSAMAVVMS